MSEINQLRFGAALRQRREELKLSLDDVAASTRIRKTYLHALEEENLGALPGLAYTIGFLRIYARQLGLPAEPLLSSLAGTNADDDRAGLPSIGGDYSQPSRKSGRKGKGGRLLLLLLILLLVAVGATYLFMKPGIPVVPSSQVTTAPPESAPIPTAPKPQPPAASPAAEQPPAPEQPAVPVAELPVLPAGGAVVRMLPGSAGVMKVSLDNQETREYQLLPEQSLNWKVTQSLACELSAPGLVRVWVDQQEVAVAEYPAFLLKVGAHQERRP
ncbi:MAG: helix-turn-helix domain-containing protein [Desulfuromonadales bacterium]|nr:helix-turn-helix domain-containing protein [Desulfuromonadales bacterium]